MTITSRRVIDSWIWLLILFSLASFIETIFWGQMGAFTPGYLPQLGITDPNDVKAWTGFIAAIASVIGIPFLPLWGALADRFSRKPIIIRSYFAHLIAGTIAILAHNIWIFVLGRSIMSFALGNSGLMMTTLSERAPRTRQGLAFSIMNSASPIGAFVGPLLGGPIVDQSGFPVLLMIDLVLMLVVIGGLSLGYHDRFVGTDRGSIGRMAIESVRIIWNSKRLRTLFPALFMLFAGGMMAFTYVPLVVTQIYHGTDVNSAIGLVVGLGGLSTLILGPTIGAIADRVGHWRVLFIGAIVSIILWPIPGFMRDLTSFTIAWAILNGTVWSVFALSFSVLSSSATDETRGRVMSFAFLPVNVGSIIGPAIGSVITQSSLFNVFPVAAVFTAIGLGGLVLAHKQHMPAETSAASAES